MSKTWDKATHNFVETPTEMEAFLAEIEAVCRRHGFCFGHQDEQGAFLVHPLDEEKIAWLTGATKNYVWYQWTEDGEPELCDYREYRARKKTRCYHCDQEIAPGEFFAKLKARDGDEYTLHMDCAEKAFYNQRCFL